MTEQLLTVNDIEHITPRELAYKITEIDYGLDIKDRLRASNARKPRLAFFLGAGASRDSGIILAGEMMKIFKREIFGIHCPDLKTDDEREAWLTQQGWYLKDDNKYGCLFEKFCDTKIGRQRFIEQMIENKSPSFGYAILADLLLRNYVNTVVTTNFDDLVYIACTTFTGNRPIVYAYGILASELKMTSPHSKVLKLHGDYLYSNVVNTSDEMCAQSQAVGEPAQTSREAISSLNMERQVRVVWDNFGLIVLGYSGGDKTIMELLGQVSKDNGFYWCYRQGYPPGEAVLRLVKEKNGKLVAITGFDDLMSEISTVIDFQLNDLLESLERKKEELVGLYTKFDKKYSQTAVGDYAEKLEEQKDTQPRIRLTAADYFLLAVDAFNKNNFTLSEEYTRKGIELDPNNATAYSNLGLLLAKDENRRSEAESNFRKAIELDPDFARAYANIACLRSLSHAEENKTDAFTYLKKAIELDPELKNLAKTEADFDFIRNDPRFAEIIGD